MPAVIQWILALIASFFLNTVQAMDPLHWLLKSHQYVLNENYSLTYVKETPLSNAAASLRQMHIVNSGFFPIDIYVLKLNPEKYRSAFYIQTAGVPLSVEQVAMQQKALGAINGGFFTKSFNPDGLFILNGKKLFPFHNNKLLSVLLLVNAKGEIEFTSKHTSYEKAESVMQTGPFLVEKSKGILLSKTGSIGFLSEQLARRTVLAETDNKQLLVISVSPVSLYQLVNLLAKYPQWFGVNKIKTAINLDGGGSSALYVNSPNKTISLTERHWVKTMILFYPRTDSSASSPKQ